MKDKHAYWIPVDCNFAGDSGIRCSNCGFFVSDHVDNIEEYYHCPKCGFIMGETRRPTMIDNQRAYEAAICDKEEKEDESC